MRQNNKITNINKKFHINPGMLVFLFIFIYILIYVVFYLRKEKLTLYQVTKYDISQDNSFNGLILRDESVITAEQAGYVAYYVSNGAKVKASQIVYSIDESGNTLKNLSSDGTAALTDEDYYKLTGTVTDYTDSYSPVDFGSVYDFKSNLDNKIFEFTSDARYSTLIDQADNLTGQVATYSSSASGTVSYYIDGLENLTQDDITSEYFEDYSYNYTKLSSGTLIEQGSPVYKILNSETWNIIIPLTESQYELYEEESTVSLYLNNSQKSVKANIECYKKGDDCFAKLTLYKYAVNYFDLRYVTVEIVTGNTSGLKIPNSSIIEKEFYCIPQELFTNGGNTDSLGVIALVMNEDGTPEYSFIETDIFDKTDTDYLINKNLFASGTLLQYPGSNDTYTVGKTASITGAYNANNGYCIFRKVNVLYTNGEYSIVEEGTAYGLSVYDNIILNADSSLDDAIIY